MKKLTLLVITFFVYSTGKGQTTFSLKECIEIALKNNPDVTQSDVQAQTAAVQWQQSRLNKLPGVNASVGHGINQGRSIDPFTNSYVNNQLGYGNYGLSAGVTLFSGGALNNAVARDRYSYEAAGMDFRQAKDNLTIEVILAYLTVLTNEEILNQVQNQSVFTQKQVERLELLDKDGNIPPSQLSDLQGQYAGEQLSVINARNSAESARLTLCRLMNIPYNSTLRLEKISPGMPGIYAPDAGEVYQAALGNFAGIKAADLKVKSAEKAVDVARSLLWPTLRFGVNVNTNYSSAATTSTLLNSQTVASSDFVNIGGTQYPVMRQASNFSSDNIPYTRQLTGNFFSSLGLTLSIPVFNGLEQRNRVKAARLNVKNSEIAAGVAKTQLQQAIDQAAIHLQSALERCETLERQVQAFAESFRAAEVRFNQGVGNSIDYLTAKNNSDRANINLISAQYEAVLRSKILHFYRGEMGW